MNWRRALSLGLMFYLLFPFLFLIFQFRPDEFPDTSELLWALRNSFLQAFGSAFFSVLFGLWGALGLIGVSRDEKVFRRSLLEVFCLLPNFLPAIFVLLATLNVLDPFPMGVTGIILIHTLINFGLVAVLLASLIETRLGGAVEQAYVEGASRWSFLKDVFFPLLKRDLFLLALFIFIVCFGSFSVPLVVGGGRGTTLEVLIYEKIRLSSRWGEAVVLALVQSGFIFALSFFSPARGPSLPARPTNFTLIRSVTGPFIILLTTGFYILGYGQGLWDGFQNLGFFYEIQSAILASFVGTLAIGLSVGILCALCLFAVAWIGTDPLLSKFLRGYTAPSTALACFSFLLLGPNEAYWPFFKIPVVFTLITLTSLYRMGWDSRLENLRAQCDIALTMGASRGLIFKEILFPQLAANAGLLAGLAAAWASGDFAVSRILAHRDLSLGLMTESLMAGYRLSQSTILSLLVLLSGLICFGIFFWGGRVLSRKSVS